MKTGGVGLGLENNRKRKKKKKKKSTSAASERALGRPSREQPNRQNNRRLQHMFDGDLQNTTTTSGTMNTIRNHHVMDDVVGGDGGEDEDECVDENNREICYDGRKYATANTGNTSTTSAKKVMRMPLTTEMLQSQRAGQRTKTHTRVKSSSSASSLSISKHSSQERSNYQAQGRTKRAVSLDSPLRDFLDRSVPPPSTALHSDPRQPPRDGHHPVAAAVTYAHSRQDISPRTRNLPSIPHMEKDAYGSWGAHNTGNSECYTDSQKDRLDEDLLKSRLGTLLVGYIVR